MKTLSAIWLMLIGVAAQAATIDNSQAPTVAFDADAHVLHFKRNFGEILGIAVNSKGHIVVLNHPGTAKSGPLYGNATTEVLEFDAKGQFVREIGEGVYGFGYGHAVRFDRYDNLWYVDKGTDSVIKFAPDGQVLMNLGRRSEGYDSALHVERPSPAEAKPRWGYFHGPTDIGWDQDDNLFVGDGYVNSRVVKIDKNGNWLKFWGQYGTGGEHGDENPGNIRNPHGLQVDRAGNVYIADRGNRRIQVFDNNGQFLRFMHLNAPYDKSRMPVLQMGPAITTPDETAPWSLCLTNTTPQYLYVIDNEPGRLYKMTLDGKIIAMVGRSGHQLGEFNWAHALACLSENVVLVADMNNWRVQRITLHPDQIISPR